MGAGGHLGVSQINNAFLKTSNSRIELLDYTACRWPDRFVQVLLLMRHDVRWALLGVGGWQLAGGRGGRGDKKQGRK
jgi:hypothetical protein